MQQQHHHDATASGFMAPLEATPYPQMPETSEGNFRKITLPSSATAARAGEADIKEEQEFQVGYEERLG